MAICGASQVFEDPPEVLVALLPDWSFARELDAATGYAELAMRKRCEPPS